MKQTRLWLTTIAVLLCSLTANAHDFEVGGIYYTITSSADLTVKVTYRGNYSDSYSNEYSGAVTIPSTATYNSKTYSVTSIGEYAFRVCSSLTAITIPESVTSIGGGAFYGCSSLTAITIPESVTSIGQEAFYNCAGELVVNCNIPSASYYRHGDFYNSKFTKVTIGDKVTSIGNYAFYGCSSLTAITIPEGVTSIGNDAFYDCSSLTAITIPESVTSIGEYAFHGCSSLTAITIPEGVTSIGKYAFYNCSSLAAITIPESVTSIGQEAFRDCSSLTAIIIPEGVTSIGQEAFRDCSSLTAIIIPEGVTSIGERAFYNCAGELVVNCNIPSASYYGYGDFYNSKFTKVTIGDKVTSIGNYAFYGCSSLTAITIPESVTSIGNEAFSGCSSLTAIVVAEGNAKYDSRDRCNAIIETSSNTLIVGCSTTIIPESVTSIGDHAFSGCSNLTSITIPEGVTSIGKYAFYNCSSLIFITLPEGVTSIGNGAFSNCSSLNSITIPENVTSIGNEAFYDCSSLTAITIPENVTSIGNEAFYGCSSLTAITIPESVTSIGYSAFYNCSNLAEIKINGFVENISLGVFQNTKWYNYQPEGLVYLDDYLMGVKGDYYGELYIKSGTRYIARYALSECCITNVHVPASVVSLPNTAIGGYWDSSSYDSEGYSWQAYPHAYYVDANNTVYSSNNGVLFNKEQTVLLHCPCGKLDNLIIPSTVTSIDKNAFENYFCEVKDIYCYAMVPPSLQSIIPGGHKLYVHKEAIPNYETTDTWKDMPIQAFIPEGYTGMRKLYGTTLKGSYSSEWPYYISEYTFNAKADDVFSFGWSTYFYEEHMSSLDVFVNGKAAFSTVCSGDGTFSYVIPTDGSYTVTIREYYYDDEYDRISTGSPTLGKVAYTKQEIKLEDWTSTNTGHNSKSSKIYEFSSELGSTFSFDWETSAEANYDKLICELDGVTILTKSGINSGTYTKQLTTSGVHTLMVTYTKDGSASSGEDRVYLKNIKVQKELTNYASVERGGAFDSSQNFNVYERTDVNQFTYNREFTNTEWEPLYVPFDIPVTESLLTDFDFATLNDIRQYDYNDDGIKDETVVEAFKVKTGILKANYPYFIRAKEVGGKTIAITNATLYITEENFIDCSSVHEKYTFTGTYSTKSTNELTIGEGYYTLINGEWQPVTEETTLGAFRFHLKVDSRSGAPAVEARTIRMRIVGENGSDDDTTGVEKSEIRYEKSDMIFDLQGRSVENPAKGIYIVNGRKVVIK